MNSAQVREMFLGNYQGWIRSTDFDWEDLIGLVIFTAGEGSDDSISIKTIEFGEWKGKIEGDTKICGRTQDEEVYFELVYREREVGDTKQIVFNGKIYKNINDPLYEVMFTKNP